MLKTSEYVSLGHPDKVADYISCYILDRFLERDKHTRYALEVQIKDNFVTLGGEITSTAGYSDEEIALFAKVAVEQIGYTAAYQKRWGKENTICADDIIVTTHISQQSPDIAQGVDADGWGDHRDAICKGEQEAIITREVWERCKEIQKTLNAPANLTALRKRGGELDFWGGKAIKKATRLSCRKCHGGGCSKKCENSFSLKTFADITEWFPAAI